MIATHHKELSAVEQAEAYIVQTEEAARRSRSTRMDTDWNFTKTETTTNGTKMDWNSTKTKTKTNGTKKVKKKKEWRNPQSGVTRDPGKPV